MSADSHLYKYLCRLSPSMCAWQNSAEANKYLPHSRATVEPEMNRLDVWRTHTRDRLPKAIRMGQALRSVHSRWPSSLLPRWGAPRTIRTSHRRLLLVSLCGTALLSIDSGMPVLILSSESRPAELPSSVAAVLEIWPARFFLGQGDVKSPKSEARSCLSSFRVLRQNRRHGSGSNGHRKG